MYVIVCELLYNFMATMICMVQRCIFWDALRKDSMQSLTYRVPAEILTHNGSFLILTIRLKPPENVIYHRDAVHVHLWLS